jgi:hypothetical protein
MNSNGVEFIAENGGLRLRGEVCREITLRASALKLSYLRR